jgi:hypothetical protein
LRGVSVALDPGGMAEYVRSRRATSRDTLKIPGAPTRGSSFVEPLATVVKASDGDASKGQSVLAVDPARWMLAARLARAGASRIAGADRAASRPAGEGTGRRRSTWIPRRPEGGTPSGGKGFDFLFVGPGSGRRRSASRRCRAGRHDPPLP